MSNTLVDSEGDHILYTCILFTSTLPRFSYLKINLIATVVYFVKISK